VTDSNPRLVHGFEFAEGPGVASRGRYQHREAEARRRWRRNAVGVRYEFQRQGAAAGFSDARTFLSSSVQVARRSDAENW